MNLATLIRAYEGDDSAKRYLFEIMLTQAHNKEWVPSLKELLWGWNDPVIHPLLWDKIQQMPKMQEVCYPLWVDGSMSLTQEEKIAFGEMLLQKNTWFSKMDAFSHEIARLLVEKQSPYASYLIFTPHNVSIVPLITAKQLKRWIKECTYPYFNKHIIFRYGLLINERTNAPVLIGDTSPFTCLSEQKILSQDFWGRMLSCHGDNVLKDKWMAAFLGKTDLSKINDIFLMTYYFFDDTISDEMRYKWLMKRSSLSKNQDIMMWIKNLSPQQQYPLLCKMIKTMDLKDALHCLDKLFEVKDYPMTESDYINIQANYGSRTFIERIVYWHFFGVNKTLEEWNKELQAIDPNIDQMTIESLSQELGHHHLPSETILHL